MSDEINVRIDLPDVVETPYRIKIRCGETTCEVYEHGHVGSGDWAAWAGNHIIGEGGTIGYTIDRALADAHAHVRHHERSRLAFAQIRSELATEETADA